MSLLRLAALVVSIALVTSTSSVAGASHAVLIPAPAGAASVPTATHSATPGAQLGVLRGSEHHPLLFRAHTHTAPVPELRALHVEDDEEPSGSDALEAVSTPRRALAAAPRARLCAPPADSMHASQCVAPSIQPRGPPTVRR